MVAVQTAVKIIGMEKNVTIAPMVFMGGIVKLIVVTAKIMLCVIKCLDNALTDARINGRETNVTFAVTIFTVMIAKLRVGSVKVMTYVTI